jgi:general secretion pathway protein G
MRRARTRRIQRRSGFTLLEVLLVIGIIALLAAFVVPQLSGVGEQARKDAAKAMVASGGTIATQLELYKNAMGQYPEELSALYQEPEDEEDAEKWTGPYVANPDALKDPWGTELQYRGPEEAEYNENRYDLYSAGPNQEAGDDDDIGNWAKEE